LGGAQVRLGRLFARDSGRSFIAAFDHGITLGPKPGSEAALAKLGQIIEGNPDGILISPGMMKQGGHLFGFRGAPAPIVRADWIYNHDVIPSLSPRLQDPAQGEHYRVVCTPAAAAELGADAITMFLIVGTEDGAGFADNVEAVAAMAQDCQRVGLPLIVESVLWGTRLRDDKQDPELLAFAARMAAELGADAIKTTYTGDPASMRQVVDGCPIPVLVLGGVRAATFEPVLEATRGALEAGAKGVVYGRNVWQADDTLDACRRLRGVIHGADASGV
jgi:fructose-bisphosphate aldolase, class I